MMKHGSNLVYFHVMSQRSLLGLTQPIHIDDSDQVIKFVVRRESLKNF